MQSATQVNKRTPEPFSFDGHGINDNDGQRIAKVCSCDPYVYPDGQPVRNAEFDTNPHDPKARMDYTGTTYTYEPTELM